MHSYVRPSGLDEVFALIADRPRRFLAGGTDLYPTAAANLDGDILDLTAIPLLSGLRQDNGLRIGACTTWTEIAQARLPPALYALQQAARQVGGRQIQNAGTVGGNLCNASPAADGVPPLLTLEARVELIGPRGTRILPLAEFLTGPRQTARQSDEPLSAVLLPASALSGQSCFVKLGARAYLVISIAMVAARLVVDAGRIASAAIAVGSCSGVARRLPEVEAELVGLSPDSAVSACDPALIGAALAPIDDVRATAHYRRTAAAELVRRAVAGALS